MKLILTTLSLLTAMAATTNARAACSDKLTQTRKFYGTIYEIWRHSGFGGANNVSETERKLISQNYSAARAIWLTISDTEFATLQKPITAVYLVPEETKRVADSAAQLKDLLPKSTTLSSLLPQLAVVLSEIQGQNVYAKPIPYATFACFQELEKAQFLDPEQTKGLVEIPLEKIPAELKRKEKISTELASLANHEETLWGDTILEGPYGLDGKATARSVVLFVYHGEIFGYGAVIAAPAVFTDSDDCEYDERKERWSEGCSRGEISVYNTYDAALQQIDTGSYAEFD